MITLADMISVERGTIINGTTPMSDVNFPQSINLKEIVEDITTKFVNGDLLKCSIPLNEGAQYFSILVVSTAHHSYAH